MTRYYFAAAYQRHAEMQAYANALTAATGAEVVSSWHREVTPGLDASFDAAFLAEHPEVAWRHGQRDLDDLDVAHAIVSFTDGQPARGGRHVEHGWALKQRDRDEADNCLSDVQVVPMRLIVVGPREHVFHCHPATEVYATFAAFVLHEIAAHLTRTERG